MLQILVSLTILLGVPQVGHPGQTPLSYSGQSVVVDTASSGPDGSSIFALQGQNGSGDSPDRTWLGWLSGFLAIGVVLAVLVGAVHLIRRRRSGD